MVSTGHGVKRLLNRMVSNGHGVKRVSRPWTVPEPIQCFAGACTRIKGPERLCRRQAAAVVSLEHKALLPERLQGARGVSGALRTLSAAHERACPASITCINESGMCARSAAWEDPKASSARQQLAQLTPGGC